MSLLHAAVNLSTQALERAYHLIKRPEVTRDVRRIRSERSDWPSPVTPTAEAGIVISGCGRLLEPLYANLSNLRRSGCRLPIEVWHLPGEFSGKQKAALAGLAHPVEAAGTPFDGLSGKHEVHGFKAWILSQSRFAKTLLLDVNSFPLTNLEAVFQCGRSCIMWRDGPWHGRLVRIIRLRRALRLPRHPFEFESGQLYVDRGTDSIREALCLAAALNTLGSRLYRHTHGDKESYSLAFDLLAQPYTIAPKPEVYPPGSESTFGGLIQPWLDGSPLFYHPHATRDEWWRFREDWTELAAEAARVAEACR